MTAQALAWNSRNFDQDAGRGSLPQGLRLAWRVIVPEMSQPETSEEDLLQRVGRGDSRAFDQLYDALSPKLFGLLRQMLHDEREAEDLISKFMQNRKICCFEITEVNPTLDKENMMAEIAFNILQRSVNVLMMN